MQNNDSASVREQARFREDVRDSLGYMRGKLEEIHAEAKRTNGRVTRTEGDVDELEKKVYWLTGAAAMLALFWDSIKGGVHQLLSK